MPFWKGWSLEVCDSRIALAALLIEVHKADFLEMLELVTKEHVPSDTDIMVGSLVLEGDLRAHMENKSNASFDRLRVVLPS